MLVTHPRDVVGAQGGGADRLLLASLPPGAALADAPAAALAPEPALVRDVVRESDVPVHAVLRLDDTWTTTGAGLVRLAGLGHDLLAQGAAGLSFGFLDADLEVDAVLCAALLEHLPGAAWVFPEAVDAALDPRRSWRRLLGDDASAPDLPGLVGVRSAGSPRGVAAGLDDLLALAADPRAAALLVAGAGLRAEDVPWLLRAGVAWFHLGPQARPGGSAKAYVDADLVRSWRTLLDDAAARRPGPS